MATDLTSSNISSLLKVAYGDKFYNDILFSRNVLMGVLAKKVKGGTILHFTTRAKEHINYMETL